MSHQAHKIRWDALTSCLKIYSPEAPTKEKPTNLYFRFGHNQDKNISHFVTSFVNNIREHTECERKNYPATFDIPDKNDVILGDAITQKITPLVYKWRQTNEWDLRISSKKKPSVRKLCTHNDGFECGCIIPLQERKASSFLRPHTENDCREFWEMNAEAFYNIEMVKTLILYGEMEPILRVCGHPDVDYASWEMQGQCFCMERDAGWDTIYRSALDAYMTLNILYSFPALWDPASSSNRLTDYRSTKLYQMMFRSCTSSNWTSEVAKYPHRAFFGIGDHQFRSYPRLKPEFVLRYMPDVEETRRNERINFPYGRAPFQDILNSEKHNTGYLPDVYAVALVMDILYNKGLPAELISNVMENANYTVKRKLVFADDPFHPGNMNEVQKYLKYCWQLMINCNMMADALGVKIDWEHLIHEFLAIHMSSLSEKKIGKFNLD